MVEHRLLPAWAVKPRTLGIARPEIPGNHLENRQLLACIWWRGKHPAEKGQMLRRPAEPQPLHAPQAIDGELRILVGLLKWVTGPEKLVLGGGGLLEAMWSHRRSTDIDLSVAQKEELNVARDMRPTR